MPRTTSVHHRPWQTRISVLVATLLLPALAVSHPGAHDHSEPHDGTEQVTDQHAHDIDQITNVVTHAVTHMVNLAPDVDVRVRDFPASKPADNPAPGNTPVLLLAGGPGFAGEQMLSTAKMVAEHRRALLLDQRGTGGLEASAVDDPADLLTSIDGAVADLEAVREAMGLERWSLLGHSWGGLLSMAYAAEHPERVAELILLSPAGIDSSFWATYQTNLMRNLSPETLQEIQGIRPAAQTMEAMADYMRTMNQAMAPGMVVNTDALEPLRAQMASDTMFTPAVGMMLQGSMMSYDFREALATFPGTCVVIQGDADAIGQDTIQKIVDAIPGATRMVIKDCGHFPYLERPDQLAQSLSTVLRAQTHQTKDD